MRYHGNIKIWKENFNQSWGHKIIPRVKGLALQSGFMASTVSTAPKEGERGLQKTEATSPMTAFPGRTRPCRFVNL